MHPRDQTIFALSSGRPPSAIAIVRISGAQAGPVLTALAGKIPLPRAATRTLLRDVGQRPIDDAAIAEAARAAVRRAFARVLGFKPLTVATVHRVERSPT